MCQTTVTLTVLELDGLIDRLREYDGSPEVFCTAGFPMSTYKVNIQN